MPSKPLEPGDPLRLGRFELLGRLGEGGQGIVYLGRGPNPGEERVAVKVLRSTVDANVLERLARELDAIHQVQPFVTAGVIEASAEGERRFVVSEFIDGPSLQERVDTRGPLAEGDLQRLAAGTATALTAIHGAGVVHRDFKPANVLLGPDGPRVVDFGIARLTDAATITSGLIGTPSYVAPEQLAGTRPTSAVDIFAWALTMIYAATGRLAFGADSVPAVMHRIMYEDPDVSGLPPSLRAIVRECLDKDPGRRPTARDLLLRLVDPSAPRAPGGPGGYGGAGSPPMSGGVPGGVVPPGASRAPVDSVPHTGPLRPQVDPTFPGREPTQLSVPGREPTQLSVPGRVPARSLRRPILAAGIAAAAALVAVGVLLLTQRSPSHTPPAAGSSSLAGHASSATSTPGQTTPGQTTPAQTTPAQTTPAQTTPAQTTPATTGVTIPAAFAGTWQGTATMSAIGVPAPALPNSIAFTFVTGARTAHETDQSCVNTLTLTGTTATVLTFSEPQTAACVAGTVTFTRHGADLAYHWTDNIEQNIATLRKA